jgi:tetratricopeptide (TPR) repeat protein
VDPGQHAEHAAIEASLARGYLDPERLARARQIAARPDSPGLLRVLGQHFLSIEQARDLGQVYQEALGSIQGRGFESGLAAPDSGTQHVQLPSAEPMRASTGIDPTMVTGPPRGLGLAAPRNGQFKAGDHLGPYRLIKELARGGMGVVYVAEREGLDRKVALKQLLDGGYGDSTERFLIEARIAARLRHPNIVGIHDVGQVGANPYFAMDFIEGQDLADVIEAEGTLEPKRAAALTQKLADALAYAHERSVLHRDIKPANVLVTPEDEPVLTDFGLAKDVQAGGDSGLTQAGAIMGTPSYMPPEQADGQKDLIDRRADVYSLGGTLYAMLTGLPPFRGSSPLSTIAKVLSEPVVPPRQLRKEVPRDLEVICLKCLAKDPEERYPTAKALSADLTRFLTNEPIEAKPPSLADRLEKWVRRNRALTAFGVVAAGLLVVAALGVFFGVRASAARDARLDTEQALARLDELESESAELRLSQSLQAVQAAARYRAAVGRESDAVYLRALLALGQAACDGRQLTLAAQTLDEAAALSPEDPGVVAARSELTRLQNLQREAVGEILSAVREGDKSRFVEESDPVFELVRYPGQRSQVATALDEVSERLLSLSLEFHRASAEAAGVDPKALEKDLEQFATLCRAGERPTEAVIEGRFTHIARVRKRLTATSGLATRISFAQLLRNHLAPLAKTERRVARVACDALGRIGRDAQDTIPALQRYLAVEPRRQSAVRACAALARIGTPAALAAIRPHRGRLRDATLDSVIGRAAKRLGVEEEVVQDGTPRERFLEQVKNAIGLEEFSRAVAFCTEALGLRPDDPVALSWRAHALALQGDLEASREDLRRLFETDQRDPEVLATAALAQSEVGQPEFAIDNLRKAIAKIDDPERAMELRVPYTWLLLQSNQVELAREQLREVLRAAPSARVYALKATLHIGLGELDLASTAIEAGYELDPGDLDLKLATARLAMKRGLHARALPIYDRVLERRSGDARVIAERALAKAALGQGGEALQDFERALKLTHSPQQRGDVLFNRAKCLIDLGRSKDAFDDAQELVKLQPERGMGHVLLASLLLEDGNAEDALAVVERGIELDPSAQAYALRGKLRIFLGRVDGALKDLQHAVKLEPNNVSYRADRAMAYLQKGRMREGTEDLNHVLEQSPNHIIALRTRAQLYAQSGRLKEARADVKRLSSIAPDDLETLYVKAVVAYQSKDFQRALDLIERVRLPGSKETDPQTIALYAQALVGLGRAKEAIPSLKRLVAMNPGEPMAQLQMGGCYADAGELGLAKVHLQKFLELAPPQAPQRAQVKAFLDRLAKEGK